MKTINYLLAIIIIGASFGAYAQKKDINSAKSTITWVGKKIGGQHEGTIEVKSGSLEVKNNKVITGEFTIDMNSITCTDLEDAGYNQKLVGHLKSDDFFGTAKYPTATFKVTSATKFNQNKASLTGDITIKGKTQSITFDIVKEAESYTAIIEIDRSKFDVKYGSNSFFDSLGDKAIEDIFTLNIKLVVS